jgi:hypothetical protein
MKQPSLSDAQLERIGRFFLAVLEWTPSTPPPAPPQRKIVAGEGRVKRKKVVREPVS